MAERHASRTSWRALVAIFALLLVGGAFGCANGEFRFDDPFDRELTLSEAQHRYTTLMRWSEFQKAKSFVAEENKDQFIENTDALEDARFTDYESESVELDNESDKDSSTVRVTYTLYTTALPYEIEIEEIQKWKRDGISNDWKVESDFENLPKMAAN